MSDISDTEASICLLILQSDDCTSKTVKREEIKEMHLKLTNLEAVAVMTSLQHYLKEVEKMGEEKGIQIEKKTVKGLISKLESMPAGEVQ
jgi:hypothetical protein